MTDQSRIKVIGAFVIGFAIIAGAYTVKNFGRSSTPPPQTLSAAASEAPVRVQIDVKDSDENGLEDWRDEFVKVSTIIETENFEEYVEPDTLTGQVGISFLQNIIAAKGYGPVGKTNEQVVEDTVEKISQFASDKIYDIKDVVVSQDNSGEAIRAYGNAHADAILSNDVPGLEYELLLMKKIVDSQGEIGMEDLNKIRQIYLGTRDSVLKIPVPSRLIKEHLDLINVYHALYIDVDSMTKSINDPMLSLIRLKRHEEDTAGLAIALRNMYDALEPFADYFKRDDSAVLFVSFSSNSQ